MANHQHELAVFREVKNHLPPGYNAATLVSEVLRDYSDKIPEDLPPGGERRLILRLAWDRLGDCWAKYRADPVMQGRAVAWLKTQHIHHSISGPTRDAFDRLPVDQVEAFLLFQGVRLTFKQIGTVMGIDEKSVRRLLADARQSLGRHVSEVGRKGIDR